MLIHPPRVASWRIPCDRLAHANPCAVNSVGILLVKNPSRVRAFSRTCRLRYRRSSGGGGSTTQVERLAVVGGANRRHNELSSYRVASICTSAAEVEGSSDLDGANSHSHIPAAALEVETLIHESASVLLSSDAEAAAQDGEWRIFGRDGGAEHLSTSSSGHGVVAFDDNLETVSFGAEFETIQSIERPVCHEGTVAEGQGRIVEALNTLNGNVPHPESYGNATEEEEKLGGHADELPGEQQRMSNRGILGFRKPSQERPVRIDPAPWTSQVDSNPCKLEQPKPESESEPELQEDFDYYIPKAGDEVTGVVVSGDEYQLDIDIGAKQLGRILSKDVKPLDQFRADEFFWELDESGASMPATTLGQVRFLGNREPLKPTHPLVPVGTILSLEVYGVSFSGRALLSARKVASRIAWQRVRQIHEQDEPIEAQCVAWNSDGLVFKIEGLRAILPKNEFLNRSPGFGSLKEHVGKWKNILIISVDEAAGKFVVSERRAWGWRHLRTGSLVNGTVHRILPFGVEIILTGTSLRAMLYISDISHCYIPDIKSVFTVGEKLKALVIESSNPRKIGLRTADLERSQGLMLQDKERVYQDAEEMVEWHRTSHSTEETNEDEIAVDTPRTFSEQCSANQDWLDFGEGDVSVLATSYNEQEQ